MTAFLIAVALLVIATLALLARPWWRRRLGTTSRGALNAAIYRDELAELERDRAGGELADADYQQARAELQRRLLEDAAETDSEPVLAAATSSRRGLIALMVAVPVIAGAVYAWLGSPAAIEATAQGQMTREDIDRMVADLAAKLEKEPDNLQGWAMLARSYKVLKRVEEATRAFEKALPFVEKDPQLLADYADLLAAQAGGRLDGRPEELVTKALALDPNHMQSLWLAGTAAFNRKDYLKAADIWDRALKQLPPETEDAQMLTNIIAEAKEKAVARKASAAMAISGRVELSAALKDKAAPGDTVFVFARSEDNPMPLAAIRAHVADLPMDFRLDDSDTLSPERKLSTARNVRVEARVAKGGDAQARPGDLAGTSKATKPGTKGLRITIDTVVQ